MIGKVKTGRSFGGCIGYVISKHQAQILEAVGVRAINRQDITDDFNAQCKLNPSLGQAVGHIALSWSVNDKGKLTPALMVERAKEYLDKMQIRDTQYLIVQHQDKKHPHIHIVYNRVNNEGSTISDRFQKQRNAKVCKELTLKYGYHIGKGKAQVNRQSLTGEDKTRYELYDAIIRAAKQVTSWTQLERRLGKQGIAVQYKYMSGTKDVQGVSFSKDGLQFKGSKIDRNLSFGNLSKQLEHNRLHMLAAPSNQYELSSAELVAKLKEITGQSAAAAKAQPEESASLLGGLLDAAQHGFAGIPAGPNEEDYKRKKRNYISR